ncbi:hypothetical protein ACFIOY_04940 [Bradyrhizobium sp. TZ2]
MRKFILIAGFVLASAAAQAGDRNLSLGGGETTTVTAPAKAAEGSKTAEAPKYIERPAVVEPKTEAPEAATPGTQAAKVEQPSAERAKRVARKTASMSRTAKPRRTRHWAEARIIRELHRHGIYW